MKRILITGGLGFIGLQTASLLVEQRQPVVLLDNLSPQIHGAIPDFSALPLLKHPLVEVMRGDVRDPGLWSKALVDVSSIVHLAAETGTGQSMYEISRYTETNVGGSASLLDYLANRKHQVTKLILASSRSVYGEGAYVCVRCGMVHPLARSEKRLRAHIWEPLCPLCQGPIDAVATPENAIALPGSIYAATKLAQEYLVRIAGQALGIRFVILRFQNVYGEGQSLKNPYTGILSIFSNRLRQALALDLYEDAQETRDFVHVKDVARAISLALHAGEGDGCVLNVGPGRPTTIAGIASLLKERFGGESQVKGIIYLTYSRKSSTITLWRKHL